MAFTRFTKNVLNVSALPDRVENQAKVLKATFDQAGVDIKEAHNALIDELESDSAAENLGAKNPNGEASTIQTELNNLYTSITGKVDKIDGKQLSTEDFTTEEKEKLAGIVEGANNYVLPEATTEVLGGIKPDGKTIVVEKGVAKAKAADSADYTARAEIEVLKETKADVGYVDEAVSYTIMKRTAYNCLSELDYEDEEFGTGVLGTNRIIRFEDIKMSPISATVLQNGNVFICYGTAGTGQKGTFIICDPDGNIVKEPVTFKSNVTSNISAVTLQNGNVLIAYPNSSNGSYGTFVIYDQNGNLVKEETQFYNGSAGRISATVLQNGNVLIAFNSSGGKFVIIDPSGNIAKTATVFYSSTAENIKALTLEGGNVAVVCNNSSNVGYVTVLSEAGSIVSSAKSFYSGQIRGLSATALKNGNFFITYSDIDNSNHGNFVIYNASGSVYKAITEFNPVTSQNTYAVTLNDGSVFIHYLESSSNKNIAYCIIYDEKGNLIKSKSLYAYLTPNNVDIINLNNGKTWSIMSQTSDSSIATIAELSKQPSYKRNYIIDDIGMPNKGEKLKMWNDKKEISEGTRTGGGNGYGAFKLPNGNVLMFFADQTNSKGMFAIYDQDRNVVKSATQFGTGVGFNISATVLQNGNIFIAYTDSGISNYGYFMIIGEDGNIIKTATRFNNGNTSYISTALLQNGNVFLAFVDGGNSSYGTYMIYDQNGNVVKAETVFQSSAVKAIKVLALQDGNIAIANSYGSYVRLMIMDSEGNQIRELVIRNSGGTTKLEANLLQNGNVFIAFEVTSGIGEFVICSPDGYRLSPDTTFATLEETIEGISTCVLENGNILVIYTHYISGVSYDVELLVYDQNGNLVKEAGTASDFRYPYMALLNNGNVMLLYNNTSSNTYWYGEIAIISKDVSIKITDNLINEIPVDTLLDENKFYETIYDGNKFIAKEI